MARFRFYKALRRQLHTSFVDGVLQGMTAPCELYSTRGYGWVLRSANSALHEDWVTLGSDFRRAARSIERGNEKTPTETNESRAAPSIKRVACG